VASGESLMADAITMTGQKRAHDEIGSQGDSGTMFSLFVMSRS
jgi:hypothetical protein